MGVMKEHVRGPIKCYETIDANVMSLTRANELVYNPEFQPVNMDNKQRNKESSIGEFVTSRVLGSLVIIKADNDVLNRLNN